MNSALCNWNALTLTDTVKMGVGEGREMIGCSYKLFSPSNKVQQRLRALCGLMNAASFLLGLSGIWSQFVSNSGTISTNQDKSLWGWWVTQEVWCKIWTQGEELHNEQVWSGVRKETHLDKKEIMSQCFTSSDKPHVYIYLNNLVVTKETTEKTSRGRERWQRWRYMMRRGGGTK